MLYNTRGKILSNCSCGIIEITTEECMFIPFGLITYMFFPQLFDFLPEYIDQSFKTHRQI